MEVLKVTDAAGDFDPDVDLSDTMASSVISQIPQSSMSQFAEII